MSADFSLSFSKGAPEKPCVTCKQGVNVNDKIMVEREILHKNCFKCGFCGEGLQQGSCLLHKSGKGMFWFCKKNGCAYKSKEEKEAKLGGRGGGGGAKKMAKK